MRKLLILAAMLAMVMAVAGPALAEGKGAQTETITFRNHEETFADVVPCTNEPAVISVVQNGVVHTTALANGTFHLTGTFTGTFTAKTGTLTPTTTADDKTYTGHFTVWFGDNQNKQNEAGTVTFNARGTAEDGTTFNAHHLFHINSSSSEPPALNLFFQENCGGEVTRINM